MKTLLKEYYDEDSDWASDWADELAMYIANTEPLYRKQQAIEKNLSRKMVKGIYDPTLAPKLWFYLADEGAKLYRREIGTGKFSMAVRRKVARELAEDFEQRIVSGEVNIEKTSGLKRFQTEQITVKQEAHDAFDPEDDWTDTREMMRDRDSTEAQILDHLKQALKLMQKAGDFVTYHELLDVIELYTAWTKR